MRGIGEGQTVSLLVIPEVAELMRRQLSKAGYANGHTTDDGGDARRAALLDVSAWLVINSMRTERLQFDQLCGQNLANIWRQNAFERLLDGHRRFTVKPGAAAGYVLDMLGEAFVSNREGSVSRAKIEGRVLALYFRAHKPNSAVDGALRELYDKYLGGKGTAFQVQPAAACARAHWHSSRMFLVRCRRTPIAPTATSPIPHLRRCRSSSSTRQVRPRRSRQAFARCRGSPCHMRMPSGEQRSGGSLKCPMASQRWSFSTQRERYDPTCQASVSSSGTLTRWPSLAPRWSRRSPARVCRCSSWPTLARG